ncbi:MAG: Rha family transcriptional regulator, partial [Caloramator sp.]|nr:Rha family transcriptional regulator [Caloramator sp.]
MNDLTVINRNGQLAIDSREVAEMIGKRHSDLLENIKGYIGILANGNFRSPDFFIESTYLDAQGKERPC